MARFKNRNVRLLRLAAATARFWAHDYTTETKSQCPTTPILRSSSATSFTGNDYRHPAKTPVTT